MRIYKPVGSKDRLIEIFQKVNKVKLNEDLGFGTMDVKTVLTKGFQALKNGELTIQGGGSNNTTIQMTDDNSVVEINGIDNDKNNYTFVFKLEFSEGDQEGVYNVQSVKIQNFSYSNANGSKTFNLDEGALENFNTQYTNELFDIIEKYVDVKGSQPQNTEELDEAIKLIDAIKKDSYPYGGGSDRMQTGKAYADEKPTNDAVRVKSPQLDKFIQEDLYPGGSNKMQTGKAYADEKPVNPAVRVKSPQLDKFVQEREELSAAELYGDAPEEDDFEDPMEKHLQKLAKAQNPNLKWDEDDDESGRGRMGEEMDKPIAGLALGGVVENEEDDVIGQEVNRFNQEVNPQYSETDVEDDNLPEPSQEDVELFSNVYDALIKKSGNPNHAPTSTEVWAVIDRLKGKTKPQNTRAIPNDVESHWIDDFNEGNTYNNPMVKKTLMNNEEEIFMLAMQNVGDDLEASGRYDNISDQEFNRLVLAEMNKIAEETRLSISNESLNEEKEKKDKEKKDNGDSYSPFKQLGTKFKPKSQSKYPKKKKKPQTTVKINEDEYSDDDIDVSDLDIPDDKNAMKAAKSDIYKDSDYHKPGYQSNNDFHGPPSEKWAKFPLPADTKFEFDEEAQPNAEKGIEDIPVPSNGDEEQNDVEKANPDLYPKGWKEMDGMFMGSGKGDGMSLEPQGDEIEQLAQDKDETGEMLQGGKGDGKSPLEFDPEQVLKGMKVEMEHSDNPMIAIEIVLDHLSEIPDYYDYLDDMEKEAGVGEENPEGDDKELTDMLLGYKSMNVGDEIEGEEEEEEPEAEETPEEEKKEMDEDLGFSPTDEKFSTVEQTKFGKTYLCAYPDAQGIETRDGLERWESQDRANRELYFVNNKEEVPYALKTFGEYTPGVPYKKEELPEALYESQIRTAKKTLSNRNVPTGMSKRDAVQILIKHNIK